MTFEISWSRMWKASDVAKAYENLFHSLDNPVCPICEKSIENYDDAIDILVFNGNAFLHEACAAQFPDEDDLLEVVEDKVSANPDRFFTHWDQLEVFLPEGKKLK